MVHLDRGVTVGHLEVDASGGGAHAAGHDCTGEPQGVAAVLTTVGDRLRGGPEVLDVAGQCDREQPRDGRETHAGDDPPAQVGDPHGSALLVGGAGRRRGGRHGGGRGRGGRGGGGRRA